MFGTLVGFFLKALKRPQVSLSCGVSSQKSSLLNPSSVLFTQIRHKSGGATYARFRKMIKKSLENQKSTETKIMERMRSEMTQ